MIPPLDLKPPKTTPVPFLPIPLTDLGVELKILVTALATLLASELRASWILLPSSVILEVSTSLGSLPLTLSLASLIFPVVLSTLVLSSCGRA